MADDFGGVSSGRTRRQLQSLERRPLHGLHSRPWSFAHQPEDCRRRARFDRHCADYSRRIRNRPGTGYDWTIGVSTRPRGAIIVFARRSMFGSHKVKLEGELLDKVKQCAEACGYASVDEFVVHALEKEVNKVLPPSEGGSTSKEIIKKRLQGLGYIE